MITPSFRLLPFVIFGAFFLASCNHSTSGPTGSSDTIASWAFNGSLNDGSGHGHNGTANGTISYAADRFGNSGKAMLLPAGSTISVASADDLNMVTANSYTLSAWVNLSAPDSIRYDTNAFFEGSSSIISKTLQRTQFAEQTGYSIMLSYRGLVHYHNVYAASVDLNHQGTLRIGDDDYDNSYEKPLFDHWRMVTLVVEAHRNISLYVDSVLIRDQALEITDHVANNDLPLTVGPLPDSSRISNVLFLHRALSASEVSARFHEGGWYAH